MKKSTLSILLMTSLIITNNIICWTLNPIKWIKREDTTLLEKELEQKINELESYYEKLLKLLRSSEIEFQSEDFVKQLEIFQNTLIEFVRQHNSTRLSQQGLNTTNNKFSCLAYRSQLSASISELDKTISKYTARVNPAKHDKNLLQKAAELLISLAITNELITSSKQFEQECTDYSSQGSLDNKSLNDLAQLAQNSENIKVSSSAS